MTTENYAPPSRDPANDDSLLGMAKQLLEKFLNGVDDMLPARVVAYDRASNRATVTALVRLLTTDNRQIDRAQIASVPVLRVGAGNAVLSFDLKPGDLGWIKANDRDISLVMQELNASAPNTLRKHSFQDGLFIPDAMKSVVIDDEDLEHVTLQTFDSVTCLAIWQEFVKVRAARGLFISEKEGEGSERMIFDAYSVLKASRPWPQMTTLERDLIPVTPEDEGAAVWLLDTHQLSTFNGSAWG